MGSIGPNNNSMPKYQPPKGQPQAAEASPAASQPAIGQNPTGFQGGGSMPGSQEALLLAPLFARGMAMSAQEISLLLRNLLQMPKEWVQLLALLANAQGDTPQALLAKLVAEDVKIPLGELQTMLEQQLKQGEGKLLKLLQGNPALMASGGKGMGELMQLVSRLTSGNASPTEALQTTLAMYLPYYPLEGPQRMRLGFEAPKPGDGDEDGESASSEDEFQLVLLLTTRTFGRFRVSLGSPAAYRLQAAIEHDALPEDFQQMVTHKLNEALRPVKPEIVWLPRQFASATTSGEAANLPGTQDEARQSIGIQPQGGVSVVTLHAAYTLARLIFEADNRQTNMS